MTRSIRQFTDINLNFTTHPVTGDITTVTDEDAIKASIRNLIQTRHYERPFHPEIGCQMHGLLFENFGFVTKEVIKTTIINTLSKFEPRATVLDVVIDNAEDSNSITLDITFRIKNTVKPITFTTIVDRVR